MDRAVWKSRLPFLMRAHARLSPFIIPEGKEELLVIYSLSTSFPLVESWTVYSLHPGHTSNPLLLQTLL